MNITFYGRGNKETGQDRDTVIHTAAFASLDDGSQGIPKGFWLEALCGATTETDRLYLFGVDPFDFAPCEVCEKKLAEKL